MVEEWKECLDGWYEASNEGRVRRAKRGNATYIGRIVKAGKHSCGYVRISYSIKCKTRLALAHQLVAEAFLGPCPHGLQINHKDGVKTNNRVENLEYITGSQNMLHAWQNGLHSRIFPQATIEAARKMHKAGVSIRRIAEETGISRHYCQRIVRNLVRLGPDAYFRPRSG